jgi:hypothetical protein
MFAFAVTGWVASWLAIVNLAAAGPIRDPVPTLEEQAEAEVLVRELSQ